MVTIRLGKGGRYGRHQEKKQTTDKQTDFMVNPGHKKGTTREILRNPNLSIKTPKKLGVCPYPTLPPYGKIDRD
jgi:hypothetical protein